MPCKKKKNKYEKIPNRFIEKSSQMPCISISGYLYGKREKTGERSGDRQTIGFHVEPVTPSSDRLCQRKTGHDNIT